MSIRTTNVPTQLFYSEKKPINKKFKKIKSGYNTKNKPIGGLWTSSKYINTEENKISSQWIDWVQNTDLKTKQNKKIWELKIKKPIKILQINTIDDIKTFIKKYETDIDSYYTLNWNQIFYEKNCIAIWLTRNGLRNVTNLRVDDKYALHGWDVESILWNNIEFDEIKEIKQA